MRIFLGAVLLAAGTVMVLLAAFSLLSSLLLALAISGWAVFFLLSGNVLLRLDAESAPRWPVVVAAGVGALVGVVLAVILEHPGTNIEAAGNDSYVLSIRLFGTVRQKEIRPAVHWTEENGTQVTEAPKDLKTTMALWTVATGMAYVGIASFGGAAVGSGIRMLMKRSV